MTAMRRVSTLAALRNGYPFASEDFSDDGDLPLVRIRDLGDAPFGTFIDLELVPKRALINDGQVVIGMDGDFNVRLWDRGLAALNQRVCVLDALPNADTRYLAYALPERLQVVNNLTYATTVKHLSSDQVLHLEVPDWSAEDQRSIADFLDRETAQIDAMIEAQRELVTALGERRKELIWSAVTGAETPGPRQAVGGVPWLEQIPADWEVVRIHHDFSVSLGKMLDAGRDEFEDDEETPYIRAANIQDSGLDLADVNRMAFRPHELARLSLLKGDILVVEGGSVGTVHLLTEDMPGWSFQKTVNRVRSRGPASTRFLAYVIRGLRDRGVISLICDGSTIPHLTAEKLRALRVPRPPYEIQEGIAARLDVATARTDDMIDAANESIALMQERRAAIISAAVTGRIDPRTGKEYPTPEETP